MGWWKASAICVPSSRFLSPACGFRIDNSQIDYTSFLSSAEFCGGEFSFAFLNTKPNRRDLLIHQLQL